MACGIGACVGCVVQIKDGDGWVYKKVCKDGPVFDSKEVCLVMNTKVNICGVELKTLL